ncbi:hypothetical protein A2U01_0065183, partial [Trifolium medium]|nr:hypothetical protein [Trifolium medium]
DHDWKRENHERNETQRSEQEQNRMHSGAGLVGGCTVKERDGSAVDEEDGGAGEGCRRGSC